MLNHKFRGTYMTSYNILGKAADDPNRAVMPGASPRHSIEEGKTGVLIDREHLVPMEHMRAPNSPSQLRGRAYENSEQNSKLIEYGSS